MPRRHKYGAQKTVVDNITFDSKKEARRYSELVLLEKAGEIQQLHLQRVFDLQGKNGPLKSDAGRQLRYVGDFFYFDVRKGQWVLEDTKGFKTPEYKLKKAILRAQGVYIEEI